MKKLLRGAAVCAAAAMLVCETSHAQHTTTVTAGSILTGGGAGGGTPMPYGTVCATVVNPANDVAMSVTSTGWGLVPAGRKFCANIAAGSLGPGIPVPDASHTNYATAINYDFAVQQTDASGNPIGQPVYIRDVAGVTGTSFALDAYTPPVGAPAPPSPVVGYGSVPSSCTSPSIWTTPAGLAYTCVAGTYLLISGSGSGTIVHTLKVLAGDNAGNAAVATPQAMANTLLDSSGTSMYLSNANPTVTGSVIDNLVIGAGGAGSQLAPGAANSGGQADVILGFEACPLATSMRESVCIGDEAGAHITGNGTGADDMIGVYIGSLAAAALTNLGGADVVIGQKAGISATELHNTVIIGIHGADDVLTDGTSGSPPNDGYSVYVGNSILADHGTYTTDHNTMVGGGAANDAVTGGFLQNDVCVGDECFLNIDGTGGGTNGQANTGIGSQTGFRLGRGFQNFFGGFQVGSSSCAGVMSGSENFLVGDNTTGRCLTSGVENFLFDADAGYALTSGSYNFFAIRGAGQNITTGISDIGIGYQPLLNASPALGQAIAIGQYAAQVAAVQGMVAVGYSAGRLATGSGDTFLGKFSGGNDGGSSGLGITTGANDTCVGDSTCQTATTESGLTLLGEGADSAAGVQNAAEIGAGQNTASNTVAFLGHSFYNASTNMLTGGGAILTSAAATVASSQVGLGSATAASTSCGSLSGAAGCWEFNVGGTNHFIPYY